MVFASSEEEQASVSGGTESLQIALTPAAGWVLTVTGVAHIAADREGLALACRPQLELYKGKLSTLVIQPISARICCVSA